MPETSANPELLPSLGRLVRGLSALFWGLPCALIVCAQAGRMEWLHEFGFVPLMIVTSVLYYGLLMIGDFQKQEHPWRNALDRAKMVILVNIGLSPFLYWSIRVPDNSLFAMMVGVFTLFSLLFLLSLNFVLQRLAAMLPDETLRYETRQYTTLNRNLLTALLCLIVLLLVVVQFSNLPEGVIEIVQWIERRSLVILIFFALLPLAMTMALIWKIKEVILNSVFSAK